MPVYFPRLSGGLAGSRDYCLSLMANCPVGEGAGVNSYPREYPLRDQQGHPHAAYRMTIALNPVLGEYYGVQGMTWKNPPLLASPERHRARSPAASWSCMPTAGA